MPQNDSNELIEKFEQFRCSLYDCFDHRQDTVMDLLDALASNSSARSPVELSGVSPIEVFFSVLHGTELDLSCLFGGVRGGIYANQFLFCPKSNPIKLALFKLAASKLA